MKHILKYYSVGNGDCSLIKLSDGRTIIIDCQMKEITEDNKDTICDVKADLLKELGKDANNHPMVDLFVNTHPHADHCDGFDENFYTGNPDDYDDEDDKDKIVIGELWLTPMGLGNSIDTSAKPIRTEARRRKKLYDDDSNYSGEEGNYLHIIGYDKDREYDSRYGYVPGTVVDEINGNYQDYLSIFIHAPFKESVEEGKEQNDKNKVSIVCQFSFLDEDANTVCKVLMGGDAEHDVWQKILDNNQKGENLEWNIFLAPHHCSWTFFNDNGKEEVLQSAEDILDKQLTGAHIVTSCVKIEDNDNNPPSYKASKEYKKRLKSGNDHFLNTEDEFVATKNPIVFEITKYGKTKKKFVTSSVSEAVNKPAPRAGV